MGVALSGRRASGTEPELLRDAWVSSGENDI